MRSSSWNGLAKASHTSIFGSLRRNSFLTVLLASFVISFYFMRSNLIELTTPCTINYSPTTDKNDPLSDWGIPDSIHDIFHLKKGSTNAKYYLEYSFLRPLVFFAYAIPRVKPPGHTKLYVYTSGVSLGSFNRGFQIAGCLVGNEVHPVEYSVFDATVCHVSRKIVPGERVSLALYKNDKLKEALQGPVDLGRGAVAKLEPGDVMEMPQNTVVRLDKPHDISTMMHIRSREGAQVDSRKLEEMPSSPRYEVCAITQTKIYPHLLNDWVDYHRRIGVDMFYIIDNDSELNPKSQFKGREDVEIIYWPFERSQFQAFGYFLQMGKSRCEWLLIFDADEYVMIGIGKNHEFAGDKPLKQYIRKHQAGHHGIEFRFLIMGPSGHLKIPKEPVPEVYIHLGNRQDAHHGKLVVKSDVEYTRSGLHWATTYNTKAKYFRTNESFNRFPVTVNDDASIVHYRFRSYEDLVIRSQSAVHNFGDKAKMEVRIPSGLGNAPPGWTTVNDSLKYTHFQEIWRSITKNNGLDEQNLVRTIGSRRCVRTCKILGKRRACAMEQCDYALTM